MANGASSAFAEFKHSALAALTVVLVRVRNPLNIGAVARAMSNFGCRDLRLVEVHAPSYEDAVSAVGPSQEILRAARRYESLVEAIADCSLVYGTLAPHGRTPQQPMEPLPQAAMRLRAQMAAGRVALLFGSEKTGLSNDELSHCHGVLGIPSRSEHASMNLGQAAAVCLYALLTSAPQTSAKNADVCGARLAEPGPELLPLAEADHVDRITALLAEALAAANYVGIGRPWADENLRALVRRLRVPQQDASALTGMLRKIVHVLNKSK